MSCNSFAKKLMAQAASGGLALLTALQDAYDAPPYVRPDEDEGQLRREAQALLLRVKAHAAAQRTPLTIPEHLDPGSSRSRTFARWGRLGLALHGVGKPHPPVSLASFTPEQQRRIQEALKQRDVGALVSQATQLACEFQGPRQTWLAIEAADVLNASPTTLASDLTRCAAIATAAFRGAPGIIPILNEDPRDVNGDRSMVLHRYGQAIEAAMLADEGTLSPVHDPRRTRDLAELQQIRERIAHVKREWTRPGGEAALSIAAAGLAFANQRQSQNERNWMIETLADYALASGAWEAAITLIPHHEEPTIQARLLNRLALAAPEAALPLVEAQARRLRAREDEPSDPASSLQAAALSALAWRYSGEQREALLRDVLALSKAATPPGASAATALTQVAPLLGPFEQGEAIRVIGEITPPAPRYPEETLSSQVAALTEFAYHVSDPARSIAALRAWGRALDLPDTSVGYRNIGVVLQSRPLALARLYALVPPQVRQPFFVPILDTIRQGNETYDQHPILCAMLAGTEGEERSAVRSLVEREPSHRRNDIHRRAGLPLPVAVLSEQTTRLWGDYAVTT